MKKVLIALSVGALLFLLVATAFAFSFTLQNLHISAASLVQPLGSPVLAAPMTSADESNMSTTTQDHVRFETVQEPEHICQKDKTKDQGVGF